MCCFLILGLRRYFVGGELGGEGPSRPFSAVLLFLLWVIYVTFVSLEAYEILIVDIGGEMPTPVIPE